MVVFMRDVEFTGELGLRLHVNMKREHAVETVAAQGQAAMAGVEIGFIVILIACNPISSSTPHSEVIGMLKAMPRPFRVRFRAPDGYDPSSSYTCASSKSAQTLHSTLPSTPLPVPFPKPVSDQISKPAAKESPTLSSPAIILSPAAAQLSKLVGARCQGLGADVMREFESLASDEAALQRLLVARQNRMPQATTLGFDVVKWRAKVRPDLITPKDVPTAFPQGTWRFMGFAKNGMPVVLVRARLWDPHKYSVKEYIKYVAYFMEQNIKRAERRRQTNGESSQANIQNFIIFDFANMSYLKSDFSKLKQLAQITSTYYPERLGVACVINANWVFRAMWKVVKGWVDERTASKAFFFSNDYHDFLDERIGRPHLPPDLGGTHGEWPVCEPSQHPEM